MASADENKTLSRDTQSDHSREYRREMKVLFAELREVLGCDPAEKRKDVLKSAIQGLRAQDALISKLTFEKNEGRRPRMVSNANVGPNVNRETGTPLSTALAIVQAQCLQIQRLEAELIRSYHVSQLYSLQCGVGFPAPPPAQNVVAVKGRGLKRKMSRSRSSSHQGGLAVKQNSRSTKRKRDLSSSRRARAAPLSSSGENKSMRSGTTSLGTFSFD